MSTATAPAPAADAAPAPAPLPDQRPAPFGPVAGVSKDRDGRTFDPAQHLPEKRDGRWVRRFPAKRGRPPKTHTAPKPAAPAPNDPPAADFSDVRKILGEPPQPATDKAPEIPGLPPPRDEYDRAAVATVSGVATVGILACGAHVAPSPDQIAAMVRAYADCYRAYGYAPQTPPWLGPVIATGAWIGPHLANQKTQENLQGWKIRLAALWAKFRGRRDARAAAATAAAATAATEPAAAP